MKTLVKYIPVLCIFAFAGCATTQHNMYSDDVYYSPKDKQAPVVTAAPEEQRPDYAVPNAQGGSAAQDNSEHSRGNQQQSGENEQPNYSEKTYDKNGNTVINNYYYDGNFNYDDYYDYAYATRLRRFRHSFYDYGYYDNYYTNAYWYNSNPFYWGVSIYFGYNWWGPSYYTYSYCPSHYWGWYDQGYYWAGYGGYGYNQGYNNGYWDGYYTGYNNGYYNGGGYYYNSFDNSGYYYGPRESVSSTHSNGIAPKSFGEKYELAVASEQNVTPRPMGPKSAALHNAGSISDRPKTVSESVDAARPHTTNETGATKADVQNMNSLPKQNNTIKGRTINNSAPENSGREVYSEPKHKEYESPKPNTYEHPKHDTPKPREYDPAPKPGNYDAPKQHDTPNQNVQPKSYSQPRNYDAPKQSTQPKSYNYYQGQHDASSANHTYNAPKSNSGHSSYGSNSHRSPSSGKSSSGSPSGRRK